jgi:CRISPR-associated endonuclease Cas3-HD
VVIPLEKCISRPGEGERGLIDHLEAVAGVCGDRNGGPEDKLAYLAGLAHDAAKAARPWQEYIHGKSPKGPAHAPLGAALFAVWCESLVAAWGLRGAQKEHLQDLALDWVRMIYRHHGALDDLEVDAPWTRNPTVEDNWTLLQTCDQSGLEAMVRTSFPEYRGSLADFPRDQDRIESDWLNRVRNGRGKLVRRLKETRARHHLALRPAHLGGRLIYADRLYAAAWQPEVFEPDPVAQALARFEGACREAADKARAKGASPELIEARSRCRARALETYRAQAGERFFTLLLPTGYGKTMTGLRVALEAVQARRCRRIIYVAPYISILSQSAGVIEEATELPVFLHHHLSILGREGEPSEDRQAEDHQAFDIMDTWQAPILATTFNQLFRALFPARAQECVRLPALDGAFLFIDEPQIVDVNVWCAFLRALALVSEQRGCQVLFSTATLPPLEDGLGEGAKVVRLVSEVKPAVCRYTIRTASPWSVGQVVEELRERWKKRGSVAGIFNTVRDAVTVYRAVCPAQKTPLEARKWHFLAAMMLPGHKRRIIETIRRRLTEEGKELPTGVVCTQVLEAGVDLSFRSILRARPIFSSVAQAAGRANRHGEGDPSEVVVFPFVREDGVESRKFVYRDETARLVTDETLARWPVLPEPDLPEVLTAYYERCREANPYTTSLQWFEEAALGKWTALGGQEPFGGSYPQVEVFIPGSERYLPEWYGERLRAFGANTAGELLDRYRDRAFRRSLDFRQGKRLSALLRQFLVSVPRKWTDSVPSGLSLDQVEGCDWLWQLDNEADYSDETGLAHHLTEADEADGACAII